MLCFFCCFVTSEEVVTIDFNCIEFYALTLFTPETPEVFCGLKHFTNLSIGIVVNRKGAFLFFSELFIQGRVPMVLILAL